MSTWQNFKTGQILTGLCIRLTTFKKFGNILKLWNIVLSEIINNLSSKSTVNNGPNALPAHKTCYQQYSYNNKHILTISWYVQWLLSTL